VASKKNIIDSIQIILSRFGRTDESRVDDNWLSYKIDQVRAELIIDEYYKTNIIDQNWLSDVSLIDFHKVERSDNNAVFCDCDVSKTFIPQTIPLKNKDGNLDLGIYMLISPCGKTTFYPQRMSMWRYVPGCASYELFNYYFRINTSLYVSKVVEKLRFVGILLSPEDGYLISSAPVPSGSLVLGATYLVKYGQIIYNNVVYQPNSTFVCVQPVGSLTPVTTYQGSGVVYLNSQLLTYNNTMAYPAGADMVRQIELEILTKEFGLERQMIADVRNDSKDDASKTI